MAATVHVECLHLDVVRGAGLQVVQDVAVGAFAKDGQVAVVSCCARLPEENEVSGDVVLCRRIIRQDPVDAEGGVADVEDLGDEGNHPGRRLHLRLHLEPWRELALAAVVVVKHCAYFKPEF